MGHRSQISVSWIASVCVRRVRDKYSGKALAAFSPVFGWLARCGTKLRLMPDSPCATWRCWRYRHTMRKLRSSCSECGYYASSKGCEAESWEHPQLRTLGAYPTRALCRILHAAHVFVPARNNSAAVGSSQPILNLAKAWHETRRSSPSQRTFRNHHTWKKLSQIRIQEPGPPPPGTRDRWQGFTLL